MTSELRCCPALQPGRTVSSSRLPNGFVGWIVKHFAGNVVSALHARAGSCGAESFDLVHTHGNLAALILSHLTRVPIVYTEHDSTPWSCRYRTWYERLVRRNLLPGDQCPGVPARCDGRDDVGGAAR